MGQESANTKLTDRSSQRAPRTRRAATVCIHCLNPAGETGDHVFPKSWYPDTTPEDIQRPMAPSCGPCNNEFGKHENYLLARLGLATDPTKEEASGVSKKALRSYGVGVADAKLSPRERGIREQQRKALLKEAALLSSSAGGRPVFPGLGPHEGVLGPQLPLSFKRDRLLLVCRKIIRGLEYVLGARYLKTPYVLEVFFVERGHLSSFPVGTEPATSHYGPGLEVSRSVAADDPASVFYQIVIWGTLFVHGTILIPEGN